MSKSTNIPKVTSSNAPPPAKPMESALRALGVARHGDLLVGQRNGDWATLPVGTGGQVLTVDPSASAGIGWAEAASGGDVGDLSGYMTIDGTRSFTGAVSGVTPTVAAHLTTKNYVDTLVATKAALSHAHAASDITSGVMATARLAASGTPDATTFLRGDQTWATPAGAGTVTSVAISGTDGVQVDSGSPITGAGTITLGLHSRLASIGTTAAVADRMLYTTGLDTYGLATLTSFARTLLDDADQAAAQATLGVDPAGTDNSTDVTLSGTGTYISIIGQDITVDPITVSDISDIAANYQPLDAGLSSIAGLATLADRMIYTTALDTYAVTTLTSFARTLLDDADQETMQATLGVDPAGTDNSTNVTLLGTYDYLTIAGQQITLGQVDLTTDVTGLLPIAAGGTGGGTQADARTNLGLGTMAVEDSADYYTSAAVDTLLDDRVVAHEWWKDVAEFRLVAASGTFTTTNPSISYNTDYTAVYLWHNLANAATTRVYLRTVVPPDIAGNTIGIKLYYAPGATVTADPATVICDVFMRIWNPGEVATAATYEYEVTGSTRTLAAGEKTSQTLIEHDIGVVINTASLESLAGLPLAIVVTRQSGDTAGQQMRLTGAKLYGSRYSC